MMESIKSSLQRAGFLGAVGLAAGIIAGWWGLLRADGADAVARESAPLVLTLVLLLPAALGLIVWVELKGDERAGYGSLSAALARLLLVGLAGAVIAILLFALAVYQLPTIFGGEDAAQMLEAVRSTILASGNALAVVGVTALSAVGAAIWANRRVKG